MPPAPASVPVLLRAARPRRLPRRPSVPPPLPPEHLHVEALRPQAPLVRLDQLRAVILPCMASSRGAVPSAPPPPRRIPPDRADNAAAAEAGPAARNALTLRKPCEPAGGRGRGRGRGGGAHRAGRCTRRGGPWWRGRRSRSSSSASAPRPRATSAGTPAPPCPPPAGGGPAAPAATFRFCGVSSGGRTKAGRAGAEIGGKPGPRTHTSPEAPPDAVNSGPPPPGRAALAPAVHPPDNTPVERLS